VRVVYSSKMITVLIVLVLSVSACDTFSGDSNVSDLETEVFHLRGTVDNLQELNVVATQVRAELDGMVARATATGNGMAAGLPQTPMTQPAPAMTAAPSRATSGQPGLTPTGAVSDGASVAGGTPATQAAAAAQTPPPDQVQTSFSQTTTATSVSPDDSCPVGATRVFPADEDQIFVVTTIRNLQAGSTISARWMVNGEEYAYEQNCWTPTDDWDQVCAYCEITSPGSGFTAGDWTVELFLDDNLRSQARFQVTSPPAGQ
jgi:hypothetical protein